MKSWIFIFAEYFYNLYKQIDYRSGYTLNMDCSCPRFIFILRSLQGVCLAKARKVYIANGLYSSWAMVESSIFNTATKSSLNVSLTMVHGEYLDKILTRRWLCLNMSFHERHHL